MKATVQEIAQWLQADVEGNPGVEIGDLQGLEQAQPGSLSFLANPRYEPFVYQTKASAVLVRRDFQPKQSLSSTLLRVDDPYSAFTQLLEKVAEMRKERPQGIDSTAWVSEDATLGEGVYVGPFACIEAGVTVGKGVKIYPFAYVGQGASIGDHSTLYPHASIYPGCVIGSRCIVHAGTVIGADGFGFAPQADGTFRKIPQLGIVTLEDGVEIGANTCIDRATMGTTTLRAGAKLDNLVQVAHNAEIGDHSVIAAQAGISGSTKLGKGCMVGGQAGFVGHIEIADRSKIDAQSGVNRSIKEPGQAFRGSPIQPHRQQLKSEIMFRKLADMEQRLRYLEQQLASDSKEQPGSGTPA